jgi:hypothetical protein
VTILELYNALKQAGVEDDVARRAAQAVIGVEEVAHLATKADLAEIRGDLREWRADLRRELADLKAELIKWIIGPMIALTGIGIALARVLG